MIEKIDFLSLLYFRVSTDVLQMYYLILYQQIKVRYNLDFFDAFFGAKIQNS